MCEKFNALIQENLLIFELSEARKIYEYKDENDFRYSESVWRIDNLRLKFISERGLIFVDIGSVFDESQFHIFDDISLMMKWQTLKELIEKNEALDLQTCLKLIKNNFDLLNELFSKKQFKSTAKKLGEISRLKAKALYG